ARHARACARARRRGADRQPGRRRYARDGGASPRMMTAKAKTRVMLVDDHAVVRVGFRMLLSGSAAVEVVGEADSGEAAYQQYPETKPDVVIMDLSMPGMGGIETVRRL